MGSKKSGRQPFSFTYSYDYHTVPAKALNLEEALHGGFAVDKRQEKGHIYYGVPGYGLVRISADLTVQETIDLPAMLKPLNFHSTNPTSPIIKLSRSGSGG